MHETAVEGALVLEAKLHPPAPRPTWVDRPALLDELESDAGARLTLVSAPAGSGKSTLLAQWVAAREPPDLAWLTLDEGDNTPVVFWTYVVSAFQKVRPAFGTTLLRRLGGPGVDVADEVLPLLANALVEIEPVTLVLDDLHTITDDAVYEGLLYLIERLPPRARIVTATQIDPPLPLSRLRAYGDLHELRDLSFSADQETEFLRTMLGIELSPDDVSRVHEWSEGWPAGVLLAALSARGHDDPIAFLNDLPDADRYVADYLWDEVLARQRPEIRRFLAETSILDRFSADLCAAVTGRDDADELLSELERSNVFLVSLSPSGHWYRFHQVIRAVLARELAALEPNDIADLHRRASEWYADHGFAFEAIEHAVVAGDMHYAADQLVRNWVPLYGEGRGYTILNWLDRLPSEIVASNPGVCLLAAGLTRALGRREDAERWLAAVEPDAPVDPEIFPVLGSATEAVAINRSMLNLARGDIDAAFAEARRAEAADPDEHGIGKVVVSFFLAVVFFFADDGDSAERLLDRFLNDPRTAEQHHRSYYALALLAYVALDRGNIDEAVRLANEALARAQAHGLEEYPQTAFAHGALGSAMIATGDLDGAEEHLEHAVALVRRGREGCDIAFVLLQLGQLRIRQGDREAAREALNSARSALEVAELPRVTRLDRELSAALGSARRMRRAPESADELTEAELRVLRLLPYDLTYREIAERLFISMNTLKTHTKRIRRKLEVTSRSDAVATARRRGLL